jgi:hypothetical protein
LRIVPASPRIGPHRRRNGWRGPRPRAPPGKPLIGDDAEPHSYERILERDEKILRRDEKVLGARDNILDRAEKILGGLDTSLERNDPNPTLDDQTPGRSDRAPPADVIEPRADDFDGPLSERDLDRDAPDAAGAEAARPVNDP